MDSLEAATALAKTAHTTLHLQPALGELERAVNAAYRGDSIIQATATLPVVTWDAVPGLPARLDVSATAKLLGFAKHDIQVLMAAGRLRPLGDPAPNVPKWFTAVEIVRLATDQEWLQKATKDISKHWKQKRDRLRNSYRPYVKESLCVPA